MMNFVVAVALFFGIFLANGFMGTTISKVARNSPAYLAGIQLVIKLHHMNQANIDEWSDILENVAKSMARILK